MESSYVVYDFVAKVQTKKVDELKTNALGCVRKIDAVDSTTTLVGNQKWL
jgi:hypothetical protein